MTSYYSQRLSCSRLKQVYDLATPRASEYLEAEIQHLLSRIPARCSALELGCGYGRVALRMAQKATSVVGIDVAPQSIKMAVTLASESGSPCEFRVMDALHLDFANNTFDVVVCVQNGICAFRVDQERLVAEAFRVLKPRGRLLISTYSEAFWSERLKWFEIQAAHGLIGPIDYELSKEGTIFCTDGFRSGAATRAEFEQFARGVARSASILEIDGSSLWCEIHK
jgi:ubiquinone/menaquinone biosynthesis C-methylase UbiE